MQSHIDSNHPDFFVIVGYLASPVRYAKIDIESAERSRTSVEARYSRLSGMLLVPGQNYYLWPPQTNKWGSELRVYFDSNQNIPQTLSSNVQSPYYDKSRISDNIFVWSLIQYGFIASNVQIPGRIQSRIPLNKVPDYTKGYFL